MEDQMLNGFLKSATLGLAGLALTLPQGAFAQDKTTIEWWYGKGGVVEEAIQEMVVTFNGDNPNYEVVAVRKGNYEETFAAMIAAYRVGQHPHIVMATERSVLTMLNSNAIIPLNKLMADHGRELNQDDFLGPVAAYYVVDDQLSAMPFNSSTSILWYNVDHFNEAGFTEGPAGTWKEFEAQLYTIQEKGISECAMSLNTDFVWSMIEGFSTINDMPYGTLANGRDGLGTEYVFNSTGVVQQAERIDKWVKDGTARLSGQGISASQLFTDATCSTWIKSTSGHGAVEGKAKFNWSATLQPHLEGVEPHPSNLGGAALWALDGKSEADNEATAAFMDFLAQAETQAWWSERTGYIPVTNAAYELMKDKKFFEKHPTRETAILGLIRGETTDNSWGFRFGNSNQYWAAVNEELQAAFTGKKSVQEALDAAVDRGNKVLRQYENLND
jgi:sn-glycerol 3-phosphate transport system substrate-binding protein